nr:acetylxylan esterase [Microbacterium endophyticum]
MTDISYDQLVAYQADVPEPEDFDTFWRNTLEESRSHAAEPLITDASGPFRHVTIEDMTFRGYLGDPIRAWVVKPRNVDGPLPTIVEFIGYNGGRGVIGEKLFWAAVGYIHVVMDTRGQGSGWGTGGDTADPHGAGPASTGFMTRGVLSPHDYYYRRLYTDAVMLLETVAQLPQVDRTRISVTGTSQGGGVAVAAAALSDLPATLMPDVPYLADFRRSVTQTPLPPYTEIVRYLAVHRGAADHVFRTLAYFDGVNFAKRISSPALYSVALMDDVVLPSTVFASYNALKSADKRIEVYEFNGHEGGQAAQLLIQAEWLAEREK